MSWHSFRARLSHYGNYLVGAPRLIAAALLIGWWPQIASCKSIPAPPVQEGFVNSMEDARWPARNRPVQLLPANAKGVIYAAGLPDRVEFLPVIGNNVFFAAPPPPLRASAFTVSGSGIGRPVRPVLTRLNDHVWPDLEGPVHHWLASGKLLDCLRNSGTSPPCQGALDQLPDTASWIARHVNSGQLVNIDRQVRLASGVFRVAPPGRWRPGDAFRFVARMQERAAGSAYPYAISVRIDRALLEPSADGVRVAADGRQSIKFDPRRRRTDVALVQDFSIQVPLAYARYGRSVLTYLQTADGGKPFDWQERVHADEAGLRRKRITGWCKPVPKALSHLRLRAFAGMLEVEDHLHESPILQVELGDPAKRCGALQAE